DSGQVVVGSAEGAAELRAPLLCGGMKIIELSGMSAVVVGIAHQISVGAPGYEVGDAVEGPTAAAQRYGVDRNTTARAYQRLVQTGWLVPCDDALTREWICAEGDLAVLSARLVEQNRGRPPIVRA
ncbi:hypothetical protein AB0O47_40165, partial [Streptomyces noursei]|uniref:hypothetical protein n=1 Tax=Streptomyces noursei TaxID=1971 RepID=UPI00344E6A4C